MVRLLGFAGKMGSGKSTAIKLIKEELTERSVELIKLAEPLYDIQEYIYRRISSVYKRPDDFIKDRKLLQFLGTNWGRDTISTSLWVDIWKAEVTHILQNAPDILVVCDDIRFDEEASMLKALGGTLVQIQTEEKRIEDTGFSGHKSESGVDFKHVDFIIENNGTLDDLKNALLEINSRTGLW